MYGDLDIYPNWVIDGTGPDNLKLSMGECVSLAAYLEYQQIVHWFATHITLYHWPYTVSLAWL